MRLAVVAAALAACATPVPADEPAPPPVGEIGWLAGNCLASSAPAVAAGTPVSVVILGEPQSVQSVEVVGPAQSDTDCDPLREGRSALIDGTRATLFRVSDWNQEGGDVAVALIGAPPPVVSNGVVTATLGSRAGVVFGLCQTSEGLRFSAWEGRAGTGRPLWEGYYGLGYDVDPTCP